MSELLAIHEAIASQIRVALEAASSGWTFQVEPLMILNPTPPTVDVYPADPSNDSNSAAFGETVEDIAEGGWVNVRARVNPVDADAGQEVLLALMSPGDLSIVQALYDDTTLGGTAADVSLDSTSGFVLVPTIDGGAVHVGVLWRFLVIPAWS